MSRAAELADTLNYLYEAEKGLQRLGMDSEEEVLQHIRVTVEDEIPGARQ